LGVMGTSSSKPSMLQVPHEHAAMPTGTESPSGRVDMQLSSSPHRDLSLLEEMSNAYKEETPYRVLSKVAIAGAAGFVLGPFTHSGPVLASAFLTGANAVAVVGFYDIIREAVTSLTLSDNPILSLVAGGLTGKPSFSSSCMQLTSTGVFCVVNTALLCRFVVAVACMTSKAHATPVCKSCKYRYYLLYQRTWSKLQGMCGMVSCIRHGHKRLVVQWCLAHLQLSHISRSPSLMHTNSPSQYCWTLVIFMTISMVHCELRLMHLQCLPLTHIPKPGPTFLGCCHSSLP
jgi:hypothetical protein